MHGMKSAANIHSAQAHQMQYYIILYYTLLPFWGGGGGGEESGDIYLLCKNTCTCRFSKKFCFWFLVLHVLVCGMHDKLTVICVGHRETGLLMPENRDRRMMTRSSS